MASLLGLEFGRAWFILTLQKNRRYPTLRGFLTQSAESLEKKGVEFLMNTKKCKRVRKSVNAKGIGMGTGSRGDDGRGAEPAGGSPRCCFGGGFPLPSGDGSETHTGPEGICPQRY